MFFYRLSRGNFIRNFVFYLLVSVFLHHVLPQKAFGSTEREEKENIYHFFETLGNLNQIHPLETAASHPDNRYFLGISLENHLLRELTEEPSESGPPGSLNATRIWLIKSLFYPLDFGLGLGEVEKLGLRSMSFFLQATLFEKFRTPALALRMGWSRLANKTETQVSTISSHLIGSWGWKQLSIFSDLALYFHSSQLQIIHNVDPEQSLYSWREHSASLGLAFQIIPGRLLLSTEIQTSNSSQSSRLKLSLDL
ncbi:MAG: hypothetical protein KA436_02445 [Oligoflexales bacterium]|nr:hypothetical protein [Oligoflexales bacterium]